MSLHQDSINQINEHLRNLRDSDKGQWMMENCREIILDTEIHISTYSYQFVLTGYVEPEAATDFKLRWT